MTKKELSEKIQGLAHIGVMVSDLEVSKQFYIDILTMEVLHENVVKADIGDVGVCFLKKGDMVIELVQMPEYDSSRKDGFVDHIAFRVKDIEGVRSALAEKGVNFIEDEINHCEYFFSNGCKWIIFVGPDNERLELNEIL